MDSDQESWIIAGGTTTSKRLIYGYEMAACFTDHARPFLVALENGVAQWIRAFTH